MNLNRKTTSPLAVPRTMRRQGRRVLTSLPAGRVVPIAAVTMFREDAVRSGTMKFQFEMMETAEVLMNAVYVNVKAYLVPWLAFERFDGSMDVFNRSYNKQPIIDGGSALSFFETHPMGASGTHALYKYMGLHAKSAANVNTMYAEAYNAIWNFRALNRSKSITKRLRADTSLAPAFWMHHQFEHIVPDFDQAVIDGEVALNVVDANLAVKKSGAAIGKVAVAYDKQNSTPWVARNSATGAAVGGGDMKTGTGPAGALWSNASGSPLVQLDPSGNLSADLTGVYAEMAANGITVSLSNIELAKKTQAFARIREQYVGFDDAWIIDMLMDGLSIPDQALKQPMLLAETSNVFGMNKRYSTDADALSKSAVNGMSLAQLSIRVPRLATGGVIMVTAEIVPEQLFERQKDPFFHLGTVDELPEFLRDTLDPEKVEVVTNDRIDIDHATPNGTFGYEPLHARFNQLSYNMGGKFYRPSVNTTTDDVRQRLWAVETINPVLSADFFLCTTIHQKPFLDNLADPFEVLAIGDFAIEGNTVFGGVLVEAMNNYDAVMAAAPTARIVKP